MKKIQHLSLDYNYYVDKAIDKANALDFLGSLELLRHAQQFTGGRYTDDDYAVRLEVADSLADMGLFNESNKEFFKVIAGDIFLEEAFYGIIKNYALLEMPEQSSYFLRLGTTKRILLADADLDSETLDFFDDLQEELVHLNSNSKPFKLLKGDDNTHTLAVARTLLGAHDIEFARQVLLTVPKTSAQHLEASNYLALIELSEGKGAKGLELCRDILSKNPSDVYALTTEIIALDMQNNLVELEKKVRALDALNVDDISAITKIALCFCQINYSVLAHKYLSKSLEVLPYDKELLLLHLLASINIANYKTAKETAVKLRAIYPDDAVVLNYARGLVDSINASAQYNLLPDLPKPKRIEYARLLDKHVNASESPDDFLKQVQKNEELQEAVSYALQCDNEAIAAQIGTYIAIAKRGTMYVKNILVDPDYSLPVKKEILITYLRSRDVAKREALVVNNQLHWLNNKIPKEIVRPEIKSAYWHVYGTLACMGLGDDVKKFNSTAKKINKALAELEKLEPSAIAALLAHKAELHKIFEKPTHACEVFAAKEEVFDSYSILLL